jgi:hypothetical protein
MCGPLPQFQAPIRPGDPRNLGRPAKVTIKVDGEQVAEEDIPATVAARFGVDTSGFGEPGSNQIATALNTKPSLCDQKPLHLNSREWATCSSHVT